MSADYRWDEELTVETAQYGVTCVACHNPHDTPGDGKPAIADVAALCKDCHNAHLEEGATAEAGTTLRHSVKEMMGGYGAIGVEDTPSRAIGIGGRRGIGRRNRAPIPIPGGTPMATSSVFSLLPQQTTGGRLPQCPQEIGTDVRCFLTSTVLS
jgi:predicted CXXCH cytochrome family protein